MRTGRSQNNTMPIFGGAVHFTAQYGWQFGAALLHRLVVVIGIFN